MSVNDSDIKGVDTYKWSIIQGILDDKELPMDDSIEDIIFMYNFKYFEEQMRTSFTDTNSIYKQLDMDIRRCSIKINNTRVKKASSIIAYFTHRFGEPTAARVSMFCTQASMALPCEILYNIYGPRDLYVAEIKDLSRRYFRIKIYITKKKNIIFILRKNLRIIDCNGNTYCNIKLHIEFDIMNADNLMISFQCTRE